MRIKATVMETFNGRKISETIPWDDADGTAAQHEAVAYRLLPSVVHDPENVTLIGGRWKQGYIWVVHRKYGHGKPYPAEYHDDNYWKARMTNG